MTEIARRPSAQPASAAKEAAAKKAAVKHVPHKAAKKAAKKTPAKKAAKKAPAKKAPAKKAPHKHAGQEAAAKKTVGKKAAPKKAKKSAPAKGQQERASGGPHQPAAETTTPPRPSMALPQLPPPPTDPLVILGLEDGFGAGDLRRAWRRFAARHHPDQGGDAVTFSRGRAAYEFLRQRVS